MHLLSEGLVLRRAGSAYKLDPYIARTEAAEKYFDIKIQVSVLRSHVQCTEVNILPVSGDLLLPREKCR